MRRVTNLDEAVRAQSREVLIARLSAAPTDLVIELAVDLVLWVAGTRDAPCEIGIQGSCGDSLSTSQEHPGAPTAGARKCSDAAPTGADAADRWREEAAQQSLARSRQRAAEGRSHRVM